MISTLTYQAMINFATGTSPKRMGTRHPSIVPTDVRDEGRLSSTSARPTRSSGRTCAARSIPRPGVRPALQLDGGTSTNYTELRSIIDASLSADAGRGVRAFGQVRATGRTDQTVAGGASRTRTFIWPRDGAGADATRSTARCDTWAFR